VYKPHAFNVFVIVVAYHRMYASIVKIKVTRNDVIMSEPLVFKFFCVFHGDLKKSCFHWFRHIIKERFLNFAHFLVFKPIFMI